MYRYLSHDTIEMMTEDAVAGFLNREFIESKWFPVMYDLNDWTPFCDNVWKYDHMCRMFVRNGIILMFDCDEDGCVERISIGNHVIEWKTIWSKKNQYNSNDED